MKFMCSCFKTHICTNLRPPCILSVNGYAAEGTQPHCAGAVLAEDLALADQAARSRYCRMLLRGGTDAAGAGSGGPGDTGSASLRVCHWS